MSARRLNNAYIKISNRRNEDRKYSTFKIRFYSGNKSSIAIFGQCEYGARS